MDNKSLAGLFCLALKASQKAGNYIVHSVDHVDSLSALGKDIKTNIDKDSNTIFFDTLRESGIQILSEESELSEQQSLSWIVDPVDGTYNLYRGLYDFTCTSLSLVENSIPLISIIGRCFEGYIYYAIKGSYGKISYNEIDSMTAEKIDSLIYKTDAITNKPIELDQSCLVTGFPVGIRDIDSNIRDLTILSSSVKKIRMLGSAATSLSLVASGTADIYFERDIFLWDVIAGLHLVKNSGGDYYISQNKDYKCVVLACKNCDLLPKVKKLLKI